MRRWLLVALVFSCGVAGTALSCLLYAHWYVLDVHATGVRFTVVDPAHAGFDLGTDALAFGKVPQGGDAAREILLASSVLSSARIAVSPPLDRWLSADSATALVDPGVPRSVTMRLRVPADAPLGNYSGTVTVTYTRRLW